ncbi:MULTISPECIES: hypothetical protein [unclassified Nostoc]|uniref:hypothetical protein n=1 Tax=unclassified Nostoc TaxID=2593658 RepID=UPI002AD2C0F3|nr:hypothetical protein [Nostoc sp. DedQUE03]MDZ7977429.1 hypothetical protein [Nostoc sp. DedQUE03]MDZ8043639.1 hypothetical protein [Nostoc sp. DedQUE02]
MTPRRGKCHETQGSQCSLRALPQVEHLAAFLLQSHVFKRGLPSAWLLSVAETLPSTWLLSFDYAQLPRSRNTASCLVVEFRLRSTAA